MHEIIFNEYTISCDPSRLDIPVIHKFLSEECYWALGRSLSAVHRSIENSLVFGLYHETQQVGFARVVTDFTTFAWLCDVFVIHEYRGRGLGKQIVRAVVNHPQLQGLKRILLATHDAQDLYQRYGNFTPLQFPERWMEHLKII